MFEFLFELLGELIGQAIAEVLVELGLHSLAEPFERPPNPLLATLGYALFGASLGGLSLLAFRKHMVPEPYRIANLVVTPIVVGGLMAIMGAWRARRGQPVLRIDRFAYGTMFALSLALVRFFFAA